MDAAITLEEKTGMLANQQWRADDGTEMDGLTLAKRMIRFGMITTLDGLYDCHVGYCLKTGVSAWERIR